ncbi:MAG: Fic family protein [Chlamydiae bacterium]|nr:Fic family protein [Chlamydiota bacterium]
MAISTINSTSFSPILCTEPGTCFLTCARTVADLYLSGIGAGEALNGTPSYVHKFIHPGVYYTSSGTEGILIETPEDLNLSDQELRESVDLLRKKISQNPMLKKHWAQVCLSDPDMKGCVAVIGKTKFLLDVPKQKMVSCVNGLNFLRSWVGQIDTLTEEEIVSKIKKSHELLCKTTKLAGMFRKQGIVVFKDNEEDKDRSPENMIRLIKARGGSQRDIEAFRKYLKKLKLKNAPTLTPAEKKALSYLGYVPLHPDEIEERMIDFANEIKTVLTEMKKCGRIDPIAIGSFVHQRIGEIHPFSDGNGRLARAFLNAILMEYGFEPVVFTNDEEYTRAVEENNKTPGHFSKYLTETVLPRLRNLRKRLDQ